MTIKPGYIRVSEILGQWDRFGKVNVNILEAKAKLGTSIHEAIIAHNQCFPLPISEGALGYFESYQRWIEASQAETVVEGSRFYCDKLKITGEVDAIVKFPGNEDLVLIDWKTSASHSDLFWQLQGQFYHYLCGLTGLQLGKRFLFVQLNKEGKLPKVHEYHSSHFLMNVCMSAYTCFQYLNPVDKK